MITISMSMPEKLARALIAALCSPALASSGPSAYPAVDRAKDLAKQMKAEKEAHSKKTARYKKLKALRKSCKEDYLYWKYTLYDIPATKSSAENVGTFYLGVAKKIDLKTSWGKGSITFKPGGKRRWKGQGLAVSGSRVCQVFYDRLRENGKVVGTGVSCVARCTSS